MRVGEWISNMPRGVGDIIFRVGCFEGGNW